MRICVFGLGYVGTVSAACLANSGHHVVGIDANADKLSLIAAGKAPIVEKGLDALIADEVASGRLSVTSDIADAIRIADISMVCVGTPSQDNGNIDLTHVEAVCAEIGAALKGRSGFHVVVMRSTMLPGSMAQLVIPTLESHSGKVAGKDFGVCINPEFLREGTAVYDYRNPPKTVIGESDKKAGDVLAQVYAGLEAPLIRTSIETAELAKYADNAWHALKVTFANEIGNFSKALGIDGHKVMDIFCQDTKLNLSPYYLKPGFAFGGSCLPKDLRALNYKARTLDISLPVLNAILPSNALQVDTAVKMIERMGRRKVSVLGFSFKAGTDDLRESPIVDLIERLIGKGYEMMLYDRSVSVSQLMGANRDFARKHLPHISRIMSDSLDEVVGFGDIIVIGNKAEEFVQVRDNISDEQVVFDLVRLWRDESGAGYEGICW